MTYRQSLLGGSSIPFWALGSVILAIVSLAVAVY